MIFISDNLPNIIIKKFIFYRILLPKQWLIVYFYRTLFLFDLELNNSILSSLHPQEMLMADREFAYIQYL